MTSDHQPTVLVLEDTPLREQIVALLESLDCNVVCQVGRIEEALAFIEGYELDIDFAFLDYHLPDGVGLEVAVVLRAIPGGTTWIVNLSSGGEASMSEEDKGCYDEILKKSVDTIGADIRGAISPSTDAPDNSMAA